MDNEKPSVRVAVVGGGSITKTKLLMSLTLMGMASSPVSLADSMFDCEHDVKPMLNENNFMGINKTVNGYPRRPPKKLTK